MENYAFDLMIDGDSSVIETFHQNDDFKDVIDRIAKSIKPEDIEKIKIKVKKVSESTGTKKPGYHYVLTHGFMPGVLPKNVEVLDVEFRNDDIVDVWLDRFLTTKELQKYDIPSEVNNKYLQEYEKMHASEGIFDDDDDDDSNDEWEMLETKDIYDFDGFITDYTLYKKKDEEKYICMFGDRDIYTPDENYADFIAENKDEAYEWFNNYGADPGVPLYTPVHITDDENEYDIKESYVEDEPGNYTIWSASDLVSSGDQIPLVKLTTNDEGDLEVIAVGDSEFDKESAKIAQNVIDTAKKQGKSIKDTLIRLDKTLNHNDPFFSVEYDRSITNNGYELLAAQTLRTLRDDLKAAANLKGATEDTIVDKYLELTGVDYYEDLVFDDDQYEHILMLQGKDPKKDKLAYEKPSENTYMKNLKDLAEDLIEKVNLKNDPDFYKLPNKEVVTA